MATIAPAFVVVNPSYMVPGLLLPYSQVSGAFELLPEGDPQVRLGEGDLVAYLPRIDLRTQIAAGQSSYNELPSCSVAFSMISTPTYLLRVRAEYDHHDTAAVGRWGANIVEVQRLAMWQAHFQFMRVMLLYGANPAGGEGIVNTAGATTLNLPADSFGSTTLVTYDNGQFAFMLMQQIASLKTRTNQLGQGRKFVILGPQRDLALFEYNVVQVTQYQRPGAGSASTAGLLRAVLMDNGDEIIWAYDDTLIGKGAGGNDLIILAMPEIEKPVGPNSRYNTSVFSSLAPGIDACIMQLVDMPAPREIPAPLPGGAIDILSEVRSTSGWCIRPEALTLMTVQYQ